MHITSGLSPASGELLGNTISYGDDCGTTYFAVDHAVPESSHTVEIECIYEDYIDTPKPKPSERKEPKAKQRIVPATSEEQDTDLTNLTWLQNITNIMAVPQFPAPLSPNPPAKQPTNTRLQKFNQTIAKCQKDFTENKDLYQSDSEKKPPYSYCTMICMAMRYNDDKMTLSAIYSWIRDNFKYYRLADPTWQNSIRHNLSLNKVFVKVARSKHEPGKGGYWKLDLAHLEGTKRISNRPHKKKKNKDKHAEETLAQTKETTNEDALAVSNIPKEIIIEEMQIEDIDTSAVALHLPEFSFNNIDIGLDANIGANVIVEPIAPPPLVVDDDLSSLLLNPTDWELQLDMLDNYLDSF